MEKIYAEGGDSGRKIIFETELAIDVVQKKYLPEYRGKVYTRTGITVDLKNLSFRDIMGIVDRVGEVIIDGFFGQCYLISPEIEKQLITADQRRREEIDAKKVAKPIIKSDPLPPGMGRCWECGRIVPLFELDEDGYCGC